MQDTAKVVRLEPEVQRHVRARLARLPAAMHMVLERGKKLLRGRLDAFFDGADDALFDLADKAATNGEQNLFFDSMREVRVQRKGLERKFINAVECACAQLVAKDERDSIHQDSELSADALSLVQNDDLEQMAALEAMVNRANRQHLVGVTRIGRGINSLVSVEVTLSNNPFGPNTLCSAAMAQIKRLDIDIKAKLVLFELFDQTVISALPTIYKQLAFVMAEHQVRFSDPLTQAPSPSIASATSPPTDRPKKREPVSADAVKPSIATASNDRQELLTLLSFAQKLPITSASARGLDLERVLESVQRHSGKKVKMGRLEKETIRLVQMLFNYVVHDQNLPDPIKELLYRMQIPVLKVALIDDAFLTDKGHVARRLLNEMSSLALGWQCRDSVDSDPLFLRIQTTINRVVDQFDSNTEVFNEALADFTSFVHKEKRRAEVFEKRTVDAEDGKARAEVARQTVASEIQLRTMAHDLPAVVQQLVDGPWSNVMLVAGLKHGFSSPQWMAHLAVLSDLIWSVQPCQNGVDRQKLVRLIPDLTQRIRQSLDAVSFNPFEVSALLTQLEEVHLARVRGEPLASETSIEESASESAPEPPEAVEPPAEKGTLPPDDPHMIAVTNFAQGGWFDLMTTQGEREETLRCRLAAYIKPTGQYIFVNHSGVKVAQRSQIELALALKKGHLRVLDNSMLFDRALETIVTKMRQSKTSMPLDSSDSSEQS